MDKADSALAIILCAVVVGIYFFIRILCSKYQQENDHWELYRDDPWD